jgi:ubiquinone biosynthesis protein UbiJ
MSSVSRRSRAEKRKSIRNSPAQRLDAAIEQAWVQRQELASRAATVDAVGDCVEEICSRLTDICRLPLTDGDLLTIRKAFINFSNLE